eukprot:1133310-Pelagomonas_calceolata.AAC.1
MYAGQVWGTEHVKAGKEFASDLQVLHMSYLESTLEWVLSVYVKMNNSMLRSNSEALRRVLKADFNIHLHETSCWAAQ